MKRLLHFPYIALFLLLICLTACGTSAQDNQTTTAQSSESQVPKITTAAPLTETTPQEKFVEVPVITYRQEPESGEYVKVKESTRTVGQATSLSIDPVIPDYYEIDLEKSILSIENIQEGDSLLIYLACQTVEVVFSDGESQLAQTIRCGQTPTPPEFSRFGYTLIGYDKQIAPTYQATIFTAQWEVTTYTVTLHTAKGSRVSDESFAEDSDCFVKKFTVFDQFSLPTPQNESYHFLAWNTKADRSGKDYTEVSQNTTENIVLYAIYDVTLYSITFVEENGITYPAYYLPYGTPITVPVILPENQMAGYGLTWYEDENATKPYHFTTMSRQNITLYGKWEQDTGTGFLAWDLENIENETIDSLDELRAFIDYIHFYNLTESVAIEVTYTDYDHIVDDIAAVGMLGDFRANGALGYGAGEKTKYRHPDAQCYIEIKVSRSYRDSEASLTTQPTGETAYTYLTESITPRGDSYTDFYIDSLINAHPVTTTNQLHYVVEHGYRPLPTAGSSAERIYLAARKLLNEILPEDATDLEKVELIFNYLVQNIQYDDRAVQISETPGTLWSDYDAFFLEGIFDHQKAVCDGIAKAFSLLCNIEGIPCVEVIGNTHAWNRVKINNIWYVTDATHGNLHIRDTNHSIADHGHFLMSDREKETLGYTSVSYTNIQANESYYYFGNKHFTYNGYTFDYAIDGSDELAILLAHLLTLKDDLNGCSIDLAYTSRFTSLSTAYQTAIRTLNRSGIDFPYRINIIDPSFGSSYKIIFSR